MGILDPARRKLGWAHHHLQALERSTGDFLDQGHYSVGVELEPDEREFSEFGEYVTAFVRVARPAPVDEWSLRVGDVIHNSRAALDYSVFELAKHGSGKELPPNFGSLEFPICFTEDGKGGYATKAPNKLTSVPEAARAVVRAAQPFGRPEHPLYLLRELSNADKHRRLSVAVLFLREVTVHNTTIGQVNPFTGEVNILRLHDGMPLVTTLITAPRVPVEDVQVEATFDVLFDEGSPSQVVGKVVTETLQTIAQAVGDVIDSLEVSIGK